MSKPISVNDAIDRAFELDLQPVEITGLLTFEMEDCSLQHYPKAEQRVAAVTDEPMHYRSSVWIAFGAGSIQPNSSVLSAWTGKRVRVTGVFRNARDAHGCGQFGLWGCKIEAYAIERV